MDNVIKQLEKENAELKAYMDVNEDFKTAWEELKAENERLRTCLDTQRIDETNQYTKKVNVERKNYKLKQTLQKIKEIAKGFYNSQCNCGLRADIEQILNIINESRGGE